jgi:hypothetical protein
MSINRGGVINEITQKFWHVLLFMMIVLPRQQQLTKTIIIVLINFLIIVHFSFMGNLKIKKPILIYICLHFIYVLLSTTVGVMNNNPGVSGFFRINFLYYFWFLLFISMVSYSDDFLKIVNILVLSSIIISVYTILLLLVNLGIWPRQYFFVIDVTSNVGIHDGYTHLVNTNLSMMIFLFPFLSTFYVENIDYLGKKYSIEIVYALLLSVIAMLLSGRRILWLAIVYSIILNYKNLFNFRFLKRYFLRFFVIIILFFVIFLAINYKLHLLDISGVSQRLLSAFIGNEGSTRIDQMIELWRGFLDNPIMGSGAGKGVNTLIRNETLTWAYEMTYSLILYNSGLIGFTLFAVSQIYLVIIIKKITDATNVKYSHAMFVAYTFVLISSATNPYLTSSFDFLWFIFIPMLYINTNNLKMKHI